MDDAGTLVKHIKKDKDAIHHRYTLECTFTPLYNASLLHICAEYNHVSCAKVLILSGAEVNDKAGYDTNGFGGQTPIFHTVNQDANKCIDMMECLIAQNADFNYTIKGLIWGKGYEWETFIPAVNPISYAMMGLLRQFQRTERDIYKIVSLLMQAAYNIEYQPSNIPNKYLSP